MYYAIWAAIIILVISLIMKGFFWKYLKVRMSFGRLCMVKVRNVMTDYFAIGSVDENFLIYKHKGTDKRLHMSGHKKLFYRCMGVNWIDVDEDKNAIFTADYEPVPGFDSRKFSDLLSRALMRPAINSKKEQIMFICILLMVGLLLVAIFLLYKNMQASETVINEIPRIIDTIKASVPKTGLIKGI